MQSHTCAHMHAEWIQRLQIIILKSISGHIYFRDFTLRPNPWGTEGIWVVSVSVVSHDWHPQTAGLGRCPRPGFHWDCHPLPSRLLLLHLANYSRYRVRVSSRVRDNDTVIGSGMGYLGFVNILMPKLSQTSNVDRWWAIVGDVHICIILRVKHIFWIASCAHFGHFLKKINFCQFGPPLGYLGQCGLNWVKSLRLFQTILVLLGQDGGTGVDAGIGCSGCGVSTGI